MYRHDFGRLFDHLGLSEMVRQPNRILSLHGLIRCAHLVQDKGASAPQGRRSVLLVGNPALPLKGFDVAVAVLAMVHRMLPLNVTWICQTQPTPSMVPGLASCGLRINLHVGPSQVCTATCSQFPAVTTVNTPASSHFRPWVREVFSACPA